VTKNNATSLKEGRRNRNVKTTSAFHIRDCTRSPSLLKYLPSINGDVIGAAVFQHVVLLVWQRHQYGVAVAIDTLATSQCTCFKKSKIDERIEQM
jgi:hypothetical protein